MKLLIVYHTQSGTTQKMADAVIDGARDPAVDDVDVRVRPALDANADDLLWCDGFILGTPENFGYMSGAMKLFLDRVLSRARSTANHMRCSCARAMTAPAPSRACSGF